MKPKYNIIFLDDKTHTGMKFPIFEMYWRLAVSPGLFRVPLLRSQGQSM